MPSAASSSGPIPATSGPEGLLCLQSPCLVGQGRASTCQNSMSLTKACDILLWPLKAQGVSHCLTVPSLSVPVCRMGIQPSLSVDDPVRETLGW